MGARQVAPGTSNILVLFCLLTRFCQRNRRRAAQSKFTPLSANGGALNPKASAIRVYPEEKPGAATIVILAGFIGIPNESG